MKRIKIHKGGRKPKPKLEYDTGTPELIAKRLTISPEDPTLATCPLDVLFSRGVINSDAYYAGQQFERCHHWAFGSPHPQAVNLGLISGPEGPEDTSESLRRYHEACNALSTRSSAHLHAIVNLIVHHRWPAWIDDLKPRYRAKARTLEGFSILLAWEKESRRKAA